MQYSNKLKKELFQHWLRLAVQLRFGKTYKAYREAAPTKKERHFRLCYHVPLHDNKLPIANENNYWYSIISLVKILFVCMGLLTPKKSAASGRQKASRA